MIFLLIDCFFGCFTQKSNKICISKLSSEDRRPGMGIYKRKQENDQHKQKVF